MTDHIAQAKEHVSHTWNNDHPNAGITHALIAIAEALQPDAQIVDDSDEKAAQNEIARAVVGAALALGISHVKLSTRYDIASRVVAEIRASTR